MKVVCTETHFNWRLLRDFFISLLFLEVFQHTQELCMSGFLETLGHSVIYNCHLWLIIAWLYIQIMLSFSTQLGYRLVLWMTNSSSQVGRLRSPSYIHLFYKNHLLAFLTPTWHSFDQLRIQVLTLCLKVSLSVCTQPLRHIWLLAALWTVAHQAPLSMGFSRQEYWSGLPFPPPGDFPDPGIEPQSLTSPALARRFFTASATWEVSGRGQMILKFGFKYKS